MHDIIFPLLTYKFDLQAKLASSEMDAYLKREISQFKDMLRSCDGQHSGQVWFFIIQSVFLPTDEVLVSELKIAFSK